MMDSYYNGISGLTNAQNALSSQSNNISNINTIAYKSDTVSFADLMYQNGTGKGASIVDINKNYVQGELKVSSNAYDLAIKGEGFFTVKDPILDKTFYTRAGNFKMGEDGTLQMPSGHKVMGVSIDAPTVVSTNPLVTQLDNNYGIFLASQTISTDSELKSINTAATNYLKTVATTGSSGSNYKTEGALIRDIDALSAEYRNVLGLYSSDAIEGTASTLQAATVDFSDQTLVDGDKVEIYIDGIPYGISFDTDQTTTFNKFSDQISNLDGFTSSYDSTTGILSIDSLIPGKSTTISGVSVNNIGLNPVVIDAIKGTGLAAVTEVRDALKNAVEMAGGEFLELTNNVNLENQDSLALTELQLQLDNLNVSSVNPFGDFSVENGNLFITQGNHQYLVGKVVNSIFRDNTGLDPQGNNIYESTQESGDAMYISGMGEITNELLELSNANFSESLVTMMTLQRAFEGSSKSITTSDEMLRTALQLKQ